MKNIITKKKLYASFVTVCALVLLFAGIPSVTSLASSAETSEIQPMGTYTPDVPKCEISSEYCAAIYEYCGDNADNTYMHLGYNINTNYGYATKTGSTHTVVAIPNTGVSTIVSKYYWIQAYTTVNGSLYQSNLVYVTKTASAAKQTTQSVNSGTLTKRTWYDYSYDSTGKSTVYFTCVYNGEFISEDTTISPGGKVTYSTEV